MADNSVKLNDLIEALQEIGSRFAEALRPAVESIGGAAKAFQEFVRNMKLLKDAASKANISKTVFFFISRCFEM